MLTCNKCNLSKDESEFTKNRSNKNGYFGACKKCINEQVRIRRSTNKESRDKMLVSLAKYREKHKEAQRMYAKEYHVKHRETDNAKARERAAKYREENPNYGKDYYAKNREKLSEKRKASLLTDKGDRRRSLARASDHCRRMRDPLARMSKDMRVRLWYALKGNFKKGSAIRDLGMTIHDFKGFIEKQFQPGMNWENYGYKGWHLDHKIPLASLDLTKREEFLKAFHYSNYQPLWAIDNLRKSDLINGVSARVLKALDSGEHEA